MYKDTKAGFRIVEDFLEENDLRKINKEVREFEYMTTNDPSGKNEYEKAFSIIFKKDAVEKVYKALPSLYPFLKKTLKDWCNIFYLPVICLHEEGGIPEHLDGQLPEKYKYMYNSDPPINLPQPYCTSLLYLNVPEKMKGGELFLHDASPSLLEIKPKTNLFVEFGNYIHSVNPILSGASVESPRLTIIVEQYKYLSVQRDFFPDICFAEG